MRIDKNRGLTLIEVLIASVISTIIMGIIVAIYSAGNDLWEIKQYQADAQGQARVTIEQMASELKGATRTSAQNPSPNLIIPPLPNNQDIGFYLPRDKDGNGLITDANGAIEWDTDNQIRYQYVSIQKELRRIENNESKILAHGVEDVQFIDTGIDAGLFITELKIILTLSKTTLHQRTISITATSNVKLRN